MTAVLLRLLHAASDVGCRANFGRAGPCSRQMPPALRTAAPRATRLHRNHRRRLAHHCACWPRPACPADPGRRSRPTWACGVSMRPRWRPPVGHTERLGDPPRSLRRRAEHGARPRRLHYVVSSLCDQGPRACPMPAVTRTSTGNERAAQFSGDASQLAVHRFCDRLRSSVSLQQKCA